MSSPPFSQSSQPARSRLPIDAALDGILLHLNQDSNLVLQAEPGAGKTTRVPQALLKAAFRRPDQEIWVLEPRRLAAKLAARRVAQELGEELGQTVGYQFRFENVGSSRTRLRFLTEGMLMRKLLGARESDPQLRQVAAVVLDEFHERHLHGDVALAYLRQLQATQRPDLRLVVMSATLDTVALSAYLGGASVIRVPGRTFEVDVSYRAAEVRPGRPPEALERRVRDACLNLLDQLPFEGATRGDRQGDLLVFLPGMAEIRKCQRALEEVLSPLEVAVLPLHGELSREEQDAAVDASYPRRKIVLATNVAETSLTLPGVTAVVDSGLAKQATYSHWSGLARLQTKSVSRASTVQRAGRAGRTAPGKCVRLFSKHDWENRPLFDVPEIQRADLAQTVLELKRLGVGNPLEFSWLESPSRGGIESSQQLLWKLGLLSDSGDLTSLGERLADWPLSPRLARLLWEVVQRGVVEAGLRLVVALSELRLSDLGENWLERLVQGPLEAGFAARQLEQRLRDLLRREKFETSPQALSSIQIVEILSRALLVAFPDRVARLRVGSSSGRVEFLLSSGGSAYFSKLPQLADGAGAQRSADTYLVLDAEEKKAPGQARVETWVDAVCPISMDWLFDLEPFQLREASVLSWDSVRGRVEAKNQLCLDSLVLDESAGPPSDRSQSALLLAHELLDAKNAAQFARLIAPEAWVQLKNRVRFLRLSTGHAELAMLPDLDRLEVAESLLASWIGDRVSVSELEADDFQSGLLNTAFEQAGLLAERSWESWLTAWAPEAVQLSGGRRCRVNYELDRPPWIESRLQDFFGMTQGPSVGQGRVALVLHLLAPNYRAVQVTQDLAGFWKRVYPDLRKELGRRYPRHKWPEDPLKPGS